MVKDIVCMCVCVCVCVVCMSVCVCASASESVSRGIWPHLRSVETCPENKAHTATVIGPQPSSVGRTVLHHLCPSTDDVES